MHPFFCTGSSALDSFLKVWKEVTIFFYVGRSQNSFIVLFLDKYCIY